MGNFYTNIVLREGDHARVAAAVDDLGRRAYVATAGMTTVVFDEQCDRQDLDEIQGLTRKLSDRLGCVALATCNHDDDVLLYVLVRNGVVADTYESDPGYFSGGGGSPRGGDAGALCEAFGVRERKPEVESLLRRGRGDVVLEVDRHRELLELLGLPIELGFLGYGYVSEGELTQGDDTITLRALGGAPEVSVQEARTDEAPFVPPPIDPQLQAAMKAEGAELMGHSMTLAFSRVDIPTRFAPLLGAGTASGYAVLMRLQRYVITHQLGSPAGLVRADDALAAMLGEREFPMLALPRLVVRAFGIKPLTPEETAALRRGDPEIQRRFADALRDAAMEML
jgi:hypothetical protein